MVEIVDSALRAVINSFEIHTINSLIKILQPKQNKKYYYYY